MGLSLARALRDSAEEARALLPQGEAWTRDPRSNLGKLLAGLAAWRAKADVRGSDLLIESDPRTTTELLTAWEEAVGLPDECLPAPQSISERRALVISRLIGQGGASRAFMVALARAIGFEVTVTEGVGTVFRVDENRVEDSLGTEFEDFVWTVTAPFTLVRDFTVDSSTVGEPLRTFGNQLLECVLRRANPAHTFVRFVYASACWVTVYDEAGYPVQVQQTGANIVAFDENGNPITVAIVEGHVVVLDENGLPVDVPIVCAPGGGPIGGGGGGDPGGEPGPVAGVLAPGGPGGLHTWDDEGTWDDEAPWTD